jgi:hypothetical protein
MTVLLLDEVGLAELSPDLPLKVGPSVLSFFYNVARYFLESALSDTYILLCHLTGHF